MNLDNLKAPFPEKSIHWRVGAKTSDTSKGIALAYIDARDVMDRLDDVCGSENWQVRHPREGYCEIGIFIVNKDDTGNIIRSEWIWKGNGAGETDYEGTKGQFSDSEKRAAVEWGVGRYLYGLPNEWVDIKKSGKSYKIINPPRLPQWAVPYVVATKPRIGQVSGDPVDEIKITKATAYIIKTIDADIEEEKRTELLKAVSAKLTNDEILFIYEGLHGKAIDSKRKYKTIFEDYINDKEKDQCQE